MKKLPNEKSLDVIREHNDEKYDAKTARAKGIYVAIEWSKRSNYIHNVKYKCDKCGQDIAVDEETRHMADTCSTRLCLSCAFAEQPGLLLEDLMNMKAKLK